MAKRSGRSAAAPLLFLDSSKKKHPKLFLPKLLEEESRKSFLDGADLDNARTLLQRWADLADSGHLNQKETALDAEFLEKVFGDALGYRSVTENPQDYHREKQFYVAGAGTADGALGRFVSGKTTAPLVVIELKGAETDLDHDKFNGRTPVQQVWDYLNQLPDTPWGIVSNYVTIRLYHRDMPARHYDEFTINDFRDDSRFRQFYYLFERNGLLGNKVQAPRADALLKRTSKRQKEVGDDLYEDYSNQRLALIEHLIERGKTQDEAIHIAQKIIDRIVFVAFCEDRALLPEKLIQRAYTQLPAFSKVTNPRWQNFKSLFGLIDKGDPEHGIPEFNGGLFRTDAAVDDLELDDKWTHFFERVDRYDFRDEVNVDVLGHLFEKSITELEKLRVVGLYGKQEGNDDGQMLMPKSALRKRFGVYYTPPQFTQLIVENTLGELIRQRVETLEDHAAKVEALRTIRVVDPACGSGAFLIAAYERLEDAYETVARQMRIDNQNAAADALKAAYPDYILSENLYGTDLSAEAVEITQLALWIRSARKGTTLADLSKNIVCGNSLVRDPAVHPKAMIWSATFPHVFSEGGGFDVVIGNPPWERMKLQEREFFSLARPDIASSVSAADRKKLIAAVEKKDPTLWQRYLDAKAAADRALGCIRDCGDYPFTGRGDINTYMLFAELATQIVNPQGRVGLLVPSGIATDDTTKHFFSDLMSSQRLIAIYDFENKLYVFPDVDGRFKFCVLLVGGKGIKCQQADFVFFAHRIEDLKQKDRHIDLTAKDLALLNPNTKTCPIFRSRRDAELTKRVYRNVPILLDENRAEGGNPWGATFVRMFDQTNDAELFKNAQELKDDGFKLDGNRWVKRKQVFVPLYEAKMIQGFDHRAAGVRVEQANWMRQGQAEDTSLVEHQNPEFVTLPRFWIAEEHVDKFVGARPALLAYKDITSATNQRTMIAAMVPKVGLMNSAPFIKTADDISLRHECCLLANLNSFAYDFVARQKVGGLHLNFFIVEQLPTFPPDRYDDPCPWDSKTKLVNWISERVLKLTCTSNDMMPLSLATRFREGIHKWKDEDRDQLRAELDAAFFIMYGYSRDDADYVLGTFQGVRADDDAHGGSRRQRITAAFENFVG